MRKYNFAIIPILAALLVAPFQTAFAAVEIEEISNGYSSPASMDIQRLVTGQFADLAGAFQLLLYVAVALFVLLIAALIYGWYITRRVRVLALKRNREVDVAFHDTFMKLRGDVLRHVHMLEYLAKKRPLTVEEESVAAALKRDVHQSEESIHKLIKDVGMSLAEGKKDLKLVHPPWRHKKS